MRTALFVLLASFVMLTLLPCSMTINRAGSISAAESGTSLMNAFQAVQKADALGVPPDQISSLSRQLNTALSYYYTGIDLASKGDMAGSEYYLTLSNTQSTLVLDRALALQGQAQADRTTQQALAYTLAIAFSIVSSELVLESHHIRNLLRRRRLFRAKLQLRDRDGKEK